MVTKNLFVFAVGVLLGFPGCSRENDAGTPGWQLPSTTTLAAPSLIPSETPVVLVYPDGFGGLAGDAPQQTLEVAVWSDGRIVWQENGALFQGRIDKKKIDELLQRLHRDGVFGNGKVEYQKCGPDSGFTVVEIRLSDRVLKMESWHEMFEDNPKLVATSDGIEALEGRNREAVLAAQPADYQRFRRIWADIRSTVKGWTPANSEPFNGTVPIDKGSLQTDPMDDWTIIAAVGGLDGITHTHLQSLLKRHGIDCLIEGSVIYGVSVPPDKAVEAIRLIKDDLRERPYFIKLYAEGKETKYSVPETSWHTEEPNVLYAELLSRPDYAPSTDVGVLLRTADMANEVLAFPYVVRIKSLERSYLDADNAVQTGHQFEIEFSVNSDKNIGGMQLYSQVWDHGKKITSLGSSESWQGTPSEVETNQQKYDKRKTKKAPNIRK